jgi:hypothetical protein
MGANSSTQNRQKSISFGQAEKMPPDRETLAALEIQTADPA